MVEEFIGKGHAGRPLMPDRNATVPRSQIQTSLSAAHVDPLSKSPAPQKLEPKPHIEDAVTMTQAVEQSRSSHPAAQKP